MKGTMLCTLRNLKRMNPEGHEIEDENTAREVQDAARRGPFRFSMCGISAGAEVVFVDDASKRAVVVDDRHVRFDNETTTLSALVKQLFGCNHPVKEHYTSNTTAESSTTFEKSAKETTNS